MSLLSEIAKAIKTKLGGTSTNNTIPRYDGTTCTLKNSNVTISDTDVVTAGGGFVGNLTGTASNATLAASATKLETARTINGVSFNGTSNITIADSTKAPLNGTGASGTWGISITGNASTANNAALATNATKLATERFINGVAFDGTANITITDSTKAPLNGTGATGTWGINITGNSASTTKLATARSINGIAFDGSANIDIGANNITTGTLAVDRLPTIPNTKISGLGTASSLNEGAGSGPLVRKVIGGYYNGTINQLHLDRNGDPAFYAGNVDIAALSFIGDSAVFNIIKPSSISNNRDVALQCAHPNKNFASTGMLHLNPVGGDVYINKQLAIHSGNLLTTTGQSTTYPMTQKAVTDALNTAVDLTSNQTIAGVKTFSSSPIVPTPTTDFQVATKKYVDDNKGISIPTAYHIYNGSVETTNTILTNGFSTTLYTGNGSTQSINTGVDMATQWGNDVSEQFGGLVWLKSRSSANDNWLYNTLIGSTYQISSNQTGTNGSDVNSLTSFNSNGFNVGVNRNQSAVTYASWNFQTTHRTSGVTNHGKPYTCHYNPYTGFTIVKYEGSGIAGHEIPHSCGRKLGLWTVKNLSSAVDWQIGNQYDYINKQLHLNDTNAYIANLNVWENSTDSSVIIGTNSVVNGSTNQFIMYGWANSYFDESSKLIGNYEIGVYQGTGASGNKIITRGKPAWIMVKRLDSTGNWLILDNQRQPSGNDGALWANLSGAEDGSSNLILPNTDGFTHLANYADGNVSGGQYLYMVVYDNDSGSGKSKYPKATDTTNLSINALVPYANGIDVNGSKVSIEYKNETITGLTLTQGKNYVYSKNDGTYGVNKYLPMYGKSRDRSVAGENPDYFDLKTMKWYGTSGGEELVTNGTFDVDASWWTPIGTINSSVTNSELFIKYSSQVDKGVYQQITTKIGKKYKLTFTSRTITAGQPAKLLLGSTAPGLHEYGRYDNSTTTNVTQEIYFTAETTTTFIGMYFNWQSGAYFDNISVFEAEPTIGAEITPRTYLDCVVYADHNGQVSYVEELPKIEYKDVIKANEYQGKNACTAWVNFDGTTTPPTIRDSYNVSSVIRTATGYYNVYFKEPMDNTNFSITTAASWATDNINIHSIKEITGYRTTTMIRLQSSYIASSNTIILDFPHQMVQIFGGKN